MKADVSLERGRNGDRTVAVLNVDGVSLRLSGHQYSAMKQENREWSSWKGPEAPEFLLEISEVINRDGSAWQRVADLNKLYEEQQKKIKALMDLIRQYDAEQCLAGSDGMTSADLVEKAEDINNGQFS